MRLFVADAKYRGLGLVYDTGWQLHGNPLLTGVSSGYLNGSADIKTEPLSYTKDDAWIQSTYATLKNDGTAKSNTDFLMRFNTTRAAHHCRKQDIPGVGQLDLPNLYELIILYLESDHIDALDPTVESNRDKALGKMNTNGRFDFDIDYIRSSTEYNPSASWLINFNGRAYYGSNTSPSGVAPVKELDA